MTSQRPDPWRPDPQQPFQQQWQQPPGPPQPPPKKRPTGLIVLAILGACGLLFAGCLALVASIGSNSTGGGAADATATTRSGDGQAGGQAKAVKLGQPARDGQFEFTVRKVDCTRTKLGDAYFNTRAQGVFCQVFVRVANIGDEPRAFASSNQKGFDAKGREYTPDDEAAVYLGERAKSLYEEINPGNRVDGIIVFDVPKGTKLVKVELHDDVLSGGVEVSLT